MSSYQSTIEELLKKADIEINGSRPWDIRVHNEKLYRRILAEGSLGLGESYMDGWWDVPSLDEFICKLLQANLESAVRSKAALLNVVRARLLNMQKKGNRAKKVAELHYNLSNDFYEKMLDKRMQYTCAYWKNASSLEEAQRAKLELVCKKMQLKPGDRILELGSGWGWFARFAAQEYGVEVVAYNISKEQVAYAREHTKGLPVEFRLEDYRNAKGVYDKVVSIGVCEHVGYKNYRTLMEVAHRSLKDHGLFMLHTIGNYRSVQTTDPWFDKYIFPNSMLPSIKQLGEAMEELFIMEDWHNFGADYDKTLMEWQRNVDAHWHEFKDVFGERFYRMWKYYLMASAGGFRARKNQLWQLVLSKNGVPGGYTSVR